MYCHLSDTLLAVMFVCSLAATGWTFCRQVFTVCNPRALAKRPMCMLLKKHSLAHLPRLVRLAPSVQVRQHDLNISCLSSPKYIQLPNPRQRGRQGASISCAVGAIAERNRGRPSHGNLCGRGQHHHAALQ